MQCGTAPRAARDLPARPVPRKTAGAPGMERPESIPLGSPPRTARRGMEPCSPVNPFFLEGGFSADFVGGPGGRPHLPEWHSSSVPPGAFSLGPLQRPVLFSLRRSRCGASAPRRECGVRRREPLCGATGVYQIKGAPAALCAVGNKRERAAWRSKRKAPGGLRPSATEEGRTCPLAPGKLGEGASRKTTWGVGARFGFM